MKYRIKLRDQKKSNNIEISALDFAEILGYKKRSVNKNVKLAIDNSLSRLMRQHIQWTKNGETKSYSEVAHMIDNPKASRSVGSANAQNPLPLYFPCHRIINANGELGRFIWGIEVKQWLLNLETKHH